jgi:hypothetical protein
MMSDEIVFEVLEGTIAPSAKTGGSRSSKYDVVMLAVAGLEDGQHIALVKEDNASAKKLGHALRTQINKSGLEDLTVGQRDNVCYIQRKAVTATEAPAVAEATQEGGGLGNY